MSTARYLSTVTAPELNWIPVIIEPETEELLLQRKTKLEEMCNEKEASVALEIAKIDEDMQILIDARAQLLQTAKGDKKELPEAEETAADLQQSSQDDIEAADVTDAADEDDDGGKEGESLLAALG